MYSCIQENSIQNNIHEDVCVGAACTLLCLLKRRKMKILTEMGIAASCQETESMTARTADGRSSLLSASFVKFQSNLTSANHLQTHVTCR